jgi:hypothetical protein
MFTMRGGGAEIIELFIEDQAYDLAPPHALPLYRQ